MSLILSYIIPAYNAEKTIFSTLDSIYSVGLNENEFEVIIVDDCSIDNTLMVLQRYKQRHANIHIISQHKNQKQGVARNAAIPLAKGEYISFVDSDDIVESGIKEAVRSVLDNKVDVFICQTRIRHKDGTYTNHHLCKENKVMNGRDFLNLHYHWHLPGAPWGYLYKSSFLQNNNIRFIPCRFHEDADWSLKQIYYADSVKVNEVLIYTYVDNDKSTVHQDNYLRFADSVHADYRVLRFAVEQISQANQFAMACIDDRTCSIDNKLIRLWKLYDGKYYAFYRRLTDEAISYLINHINKQLCHKRTILLLRHKCLSVVLLYLLAYPVSKLRKLVR